ADHRTAAGRAVGMVAVRPAGAGRGCDAGDPVERRPGSACARAAIHARGLPGLAARRSARHAGADRARRPLPAPAGRRHVPEPRTPAAGPVARLLPRVHGAQPGFARSRRKAHRGRRRSARGVLLHRRPLPQLPPLHAHGGTAMSASALRGLLADASQNGTYFIDARDRGGLDDVARGLGFAAVAIDLSGCRDKDEAFERFAAALRFPDWFGRNWDALADCLDDLSW